MDAYLESLVKKGAVVEPAEEAVEEVEEVVESVEEVTKQDEKVTESASDAANVEKVIKKVEEIAEKVAEKASNEKKEVKGKSPKQVEDNKDMKGQTIAVTNIRVHNIPDPKSVFKIISGNIVVGSIVNGMYQVDYVKPGFGLVKGFTSDLK